MKNVCLTFYTYAFHKHHTMVVHEWLLEFAKKHNMPGGAAFKSIAGFGHRGIMHEEHFFELASNVPIEIKFIMSENEANHLLELIHKENLDLFYTISEVTSGRTA